MENVKAKTLAKFLNCGVEKISKTSEDNIYAFGKEEYLVLTDEEADAKAKEEILETVWAFNKSFLDYHSEAISELNEKTFSELQGIYEAANKAILAMIDDKESFLEDAIASDGRGHFLSLYDGDEIEQDEYYIYRIN